MYGFKAFDKDLRCQGGEDFINHSKWFQYRIGGEYKLEDYEELSICERGFHFCKTLSDVYRYYPLDSRICVIEAKGDIINDIFASVTNDIVILKEITDQEVLAEARRPWLTPEMQKFRAIIE